MAIDNISPPATSTIAPGDSFSFRVDDTYTTITVEVDTDSGYEYAYDSALGGAQAGYGVSVVDLGSRHEFTVTRTSGWDKSPFSIRVVENETGSETTTTTTYSLTTETDFPQEADPYYDGFTGTSDGSSSGSGATTGIGIWTLLTSTPGTQQVKWNSLTPASVTRIDFHDDREGGADVNGLLLDNVRVGDWLLFERTSSPTAQYAYFKVTSNPSYISPETIFAGLTYMAGIGTWEIGHSVSVKHIKAPTTGVNAHRGASWNFDTSETTTPTSGKFSFDSDAAPTTMYLHMQNQEVADMSYAIEDWSGHNIVATDQTNSSLQIRFTVGTPVKVGSVYTLPLTFDSGNAGSFVDGREFYFDVLGVGTVSTTDELGSGIGYWMPLTGLGPPAWNAPTTGLIGFDATDMGSTTEIYIHEEQYLDPAGVKYNSVLSSLVTGDQIILKEKWDDTEVAIYTLAADATYAAGVIHLSSVTHEDSSLNSWPGVEMSIEIVKAGVSGSYVTTDGTTLQDAVYFTERSAHVNTPGAGFAELWVDEIDGGAGPVQRLFFTDDAGDDREVVTLDVALSGTSVNRVPFMADTGVSRITTDSNFLYVSSSDELRLEGNANLALGETATAPTAAAGRGYIWVKDDTPNTPHFTDDTGTAHNLLGRFHTIALGGRIFALNAGTWYTQDYYSPWSDGTNWDVSGGTGTHPNPSNWYKAVTLLAPFDCTLTDMALHYNVSDPLIEGDFRFYKIATADGTSTQTFTQLGSDFNINSATNISHVYIDEQTGLSDSIDKGNKLCIFYKTSNAITSFTSQFSFYANLKERF